MKDKNLTIRIAVLGASGYTGSELIKLALLHPFIEIVFLSSERHIGKRIDDIFPHFSGSNLPNFSKIDNLFKQDLGLDFIFCCLPHSTSQAIIKRIFEEKNFKNKIKVIDLSADFRISDPENYEKIYGKKHIAFRFTAEGNIWFN